MGLFALTENRVKCGRCGSEFDLNKNQEGCPLCGFGVKNSFSESKSIEKTIATNKPMISAGNYLSIPKDIQLSKGEIHLDEDGKEVGLWGMFNDYFSGKAVLRICANILNERKLSEIELSELIEIVKIEIRSKKLYLLKGFPSSDKDGAVNRLVYHFIKGFYNMGLFEMKVKDGKPEKENIWNEDWSRLMVKPTREGLEFAKIKNKVFDLGDYENQILTDEEKKWIINYLKQIDGKGFKEFYWLNEVYSFVKRGHNGKNDLWEWYKKNPLFVAYVKKWSNKSDNSKEFEKQLSNLAQTFSSGKISLLRELGVIKNKRNDYTIIGELK
jgi:ribosomal protein L37E